MGRGNESLFAASGSHDPQCFTNVKISGERLQDQWSSGLFCENISCINVAICDLEHDVLIVQTIHVQCYLQFPRHNTLGKISRCCLQLT